MRKVLLGLALLAFSSSAFAQTLPVRGQSGYDTGPIVNCTALDGSGTARCLMPGTVIYDANGAPLGSVTNPLNVAGGGNSTDATGNGTLALATLNATYIIPLSNGRSSVGLTVNGLTGSGATITVERSNDGGTTWTNANTTEGSTVSSLSATITANGQGRVGVAGATNIRLRVSTVGTGTATINYAASTATGPVFLISTLPTKAVLDTGVIGNVGIVGSNSIATGQVAATTSATQLVAARPGRQRVVTYLGAANACYIGNVGVTTTTGFPIGATVGASAPLNTQAAIYVVCAAATTVSYEEDYN